MTRNPLQSVLEGLDYQPAPGFREALRAQLLADLSPEDAARSDSHLDAGDGADQPQEIPVLKKIDRSRSVPPRTRALLAIAASVIVVAGVTAVVVNYRSSDTSQADNSADLAIAGAGLISVDQLGPGWRREFATDPAWADFQQLFAAEPQCAEYTAVAQHQDVPAAGAMTALINLQRQIVTETLTVYSSTDAASLAMDEIASPGFKDCFFAIWDTASEIGFPGTASTSAFDIAPPAPHGDRQIDFGMETTISVGSSTRLYHNVWIQVDRSIIALTVSPDGLGSDNPAGNLEKAISTALVSLNDAMSAGSSP